MDSIPTKKEVENQAEGLENPIETLEQIGVAINEAWKLFEEAIRKEVEDAAKN